MESGLVFSRRDRQFLPKIELAILLFLTFTTAAAASIAEARIQLVRQRPDIMASEALLHAASAQIGVATANSILMITFANDQRKAGLNAHDAALSAGLTRLRPVIMTALAMIIGMLPMAFAMGEAGEQNAPLGRAVIGGLLVATLLTLFVVPVIYSLLRTQMPVKHLLDERFRAAERGEEQMENSP